MNKKFSITKTIDFDKLDREIDEYMMQTGETNLCICMHIDTARAIYNALPVEFITPSLQENCKGSIGYWEGYQMLTDNNLEFGEIEIRRPKCEHEWYKVGSVAGTKARYTVFVCSKCGKQETRKQIFNKKDGTYKIYVLDDDT